MSAEFNPKQMPKQAIQLPLKQMLKPALKEPKSSKESLPDYWSDA
jgi:hypothetical protein